MSGQSSGLYTAPAAAFLAFFLLFLTCISVPFAQEIRFFTLVDRHTGGSIKFGLWGYCLSKGIEDYPQCSLPKIGWTFQNIHTLVGLDDSISPISTGILFIHPIAAICVFIVFIVTIALILKSSSQHNSPAKSRRKSSHDYISPTLIVLAAMITTIAFAVDVIFIVNVKRRVKEASLPARNMKTYTGAIIWLTAFAALILWLATIMLSVMGKDKSRDERFADESTSAYDSDVSSRRRDTPTHSMRSSGSQQHSEYSMHSRTMSVSHGDDEDWRAESIFSRRSQLSPSRKESRISHNADDSYDSADDPPPKEKLHSFLAACLPCLKRRKDEDMDEREDDIELGEMRDSDTRLDTDSLRSRQTGKSSDMFHEERGMSSVKYVSSLDRHSEDPPEDESHGFFAACLPCLKRRKDVNKDVEEEDIELSEMRDPEPRLDTDSLRSSVEDLPSRAINSSDVFDDEERVKSSVIDVSDLGSHSRYSGTLSGRGVSDNDGSMYSPPRTPSPSYIDRDGSEGSYASSRQQPPASLSYRKSSSVRSMSTLRTSHGAYSDDDIMIDNESSLASKQGSLTNYPPGSGTSFRSDLGSISRELEGTPPSTPFSDGSMASYVGERTPSGSVGSVVSRDSLGTPFSSPVSNRHESYVSEPPVSSSYRSGPLSSYPASTGEQDYVSGRGLMSMQISDRSPDYYESVEEFSTRPRTRSEMYESEPILSSPDDRVSSLELYESGQPTSSVYRDDASREIGQTPVLSGNEDYDSNTASFSRSLSDAPEDYRSGQSVPSTVYPTGEGDDDFERAMSDRPSSVIQSSLPGLSSERGMSTGYEGEHSLSTWRSSYASDPLLPSSLNPENSESNLSHEPSAVNYSRGSGVEYSTGREGDPEDFISSRSEEMSDMAGNDSYMSEPPGSSIVSNESQMANYPSGTGMSFRSDMGSTSRGFEGTQSSAPFSDGLRSMASYMGEATPSSAVDSVLSNDSFATPLSSPVLSRHESYVSELPISASYRSGPLSSYPASTGEQDYESGQGWSSAQVSDRPPDYHESVGEFSSSPRSRLSSEGYGQESHPSFVSDAAYESNPNPSSPLSDGVSMYDSRQPASSIYRDDVSREIGQTPVLSDNEDYESNIASFSRPLSESLESPEDYGQSVPSTVYPTDEGDGDFERTMSDHPSSVIQSSLPGLSSERDSFSPASTNYNGLEFEPEASTLPSSRSDTVLDYEEEQVSPPTSHLDISTGHEDENPLSTWRSSYASDSFLPSSPDSENSESNLSYEPSAAIDSRGSGMEYSTGREWNSEDFIGSRSEEMSDIAGNDTCMSEPPGSSIVSNEGELTNYSSERGTSFRLDMDDTPPSTPFSEGSRSMASYMGETRPSGAVGSVVSDDSFETPLSSPVSNRLESYVSEPPISSSYRSGPLSSYPVSAGEQDYESGRGLTSQVSDRSPDYYESEEGSSSAQLSSRLRSEGHDEELHSPFASNASYESAVSHEALETPLSSPVSSMRESYESELPVSASYRSGPLSSYPASTGEQDYESGQGSSSAQISDRSPEDLGSVEEVSSPPRSRRLSSEGYDEESHPSFASNASYESDLPSSPLSDRASSLAMYESGQPASSVYRDDFSQENGETPVLSDNEDYGSNITSFSRSLSDTTESPEYYRSGQSVPSTVYPTDDSGGDFERAPSDRLSSVIQSEPEPETPLANGSDPISDYEGEQVSPLTSLSDNSTDHEGVDPLSGWRSSYESKSLSPSSLDPQYSESNLIYESRPATNSRGSGMNYTTEQEGDSDFIGSRSEEMSDMAGDDSYMSEPPESSLVSNEGEFTNYPYGSGTSFRSELRSTGNEFDGTPSSTLFSDGSRPMSSYVDETTPSGSVGSAVSQESSKTPLSSSVPYSHESYESELPASSSYRSGRLSSYPASTGEQDYESGQGWSSAQTSDRSPEYHESIGELSSPPRSRRLSSEGYDQESHPSFASFESDPTPSSLLSDRVSSLEIYESGQPASSVYRDDSSRENGETPVLSDNEDYDSNLASFSHSLSDTTESPEYYRSGQSAPSTVYPTDDNDSEFERAPSDRPSSVTQSSLPVLSSERDSLSPAFAGDMSTGHEGENPLSTWRSSYGSELLSPSSLDPENSESSLSHEPSAAIDSQGSGMKYSTGREGDSEDFVGSRSEEMSDMAGDGSYMSEPAESSLVSNEGPLTNDPSGSGTSFRSDLGSTGNEFEGTPSSTPFSDGSRSVASYVTAVSSSSGAVDSVVSHDSLRTPLSSPVSDRYESYVSETPVSSSYRSGPLSSYSISTGERNYESGQGWTSQVSDRSPGYHESVGGSSSAQLSSRLPSDGYDEELHSSFASNASYRSMESLDSLETSLSSPALGRRESYESELPASSSYRSGQLSSYPASTGEQDYESGQGWSSAQISDRSPEYHESIGEFSSPRLSRRLSSEGYGQESHSSFVSDEAYESDLPSSPLSDRVSSPTLYESERPASSVYQDDSSRELGQTPLLSDNEDYGSGIASFSRPLSDTTESPENYLSEQPVPSTVYPTDDSDSEYERASSDRPSSVIQSSLPGPSSERGSLSPAFTDMSAGHEDENPLSDWRSSYDSEPLLPSSLDPGNPESSLNYEPEPATDSRVSGIDYTTERGDSEHFTGSRSEEMSGMAGEDSYMSELPESPVVSNESHLTNYPSGSGTSFRSDMDDTSRGSESTQSSAKFSDGSRSMASYMGETTLSGAVDSVVSDDLFETPLSSPVSNRRESYVSEPPISSGYRSGPLSTYPDSADEQDYESGRGWTSASTSHRSPGYDGSVGGSFSAQLSSRLPSDGYDEELQSSFTPNASYRSMESRGSLETPLSPPVSNRYESYVSESPMPSSYRSGQLSSYPDSAGERNYESGQGWTSAKTSDMSPQYHESAGEFSPPPRSSRLSSKGYDQESYHSFVSDALYESEPIPSSLLSDRMSSSTIYESGQPTSSIYRDDTSQDIEQTPPLPNNEDYGSDIASFSRALSDATGSLIDSRSEQSIPSTVYPTDNSDSEYERASSVHPSSVIQSSPPGSTLEQDSLSHPSMYDDDPEFEPEPTTLPSSRSDTASDYEGEQMSPLTSRSEMSSGHEDEYPPSTWRSSYESEPLSHSSLDPENLESNLSYEPGSATYSRGSGMVAERGEDSEPFVGSRSEEMSGMAVTDSYNSEPRQSSLISNEGELTNYPTGSGASFQSDMGGTSRDFEGTPQSTPFSEGTRSMASYVDETTAVSSYSGVVDSAVSSDSLRTPLSSPISERHESYVSEPPVSSSYRSGSLSSYPASAGEQDYEPGAGRTSAQTSDRSLEYLESVGEFSSRPRSSRLPTEGYDQESYSSFASNASSESAVSRDSSQSPFSSPVSSRRESYASVFSSYRSGPLLSTPASTDERDYESGQGWTSAQTSNRSPEYLGSVGEFSSRSLSNELPSEGYDQEPYPSFVPDASYGSEPIPSSLLSDRMSSPAMYESGQPVSSVYWDFTSQDIGQTPPLSDHEEYGSDIASNSRLLSDTTGFREDPGSGQSLPPTVYPTDDSDDNYEREPLDRPSSIIQSSLPSSALEGEYLSPVLTDDDSMVSEPEGSTPPSSESDTVLNYEGEYMSPLTTLSNMSMGHEGELPLSSSGSRHDSEPLWSSSLDPEKSVSDLSYESRLTTDSLDSALDDSTEREGDSEHFVGSRSGQMSDMEEIPRVCEYCGAYIYA